MEKEIWIEKIMSSADKLTQIQPSNNLFSKIKMRSIEQRVPQKTIWLVAASIVVLVMLNITVLQLNTTSTIENSNNYLAETASQNNQMY